MHADALELPIFELPLVLLPGELLPLHIFEERYKRMIGSCLEQGEPFGVVFRDAERGARRVGCEARVTEVTERFEDGRLNVVVTGERPFRVLDRFEAPEFPAGEVEPVEAGPESESPAGEAPAPGPPASPDPDPDPLASAAADDDDDDAEGGEASPAALAREAFAELVRRVGGADPDRAELEALGSYGVAARVELPPETKQRLLELRSEPERMRVLARALGTLLEAVTRSREVAERAKLNGKVIVG